MRFGKVQGFIPKMVAEGSDFFRFESSIFKIADSKRNTKMMGHH